MNPTKVAPKIRFNFDPQVIEQMTWEEFEAFERAQDGELKLYLLRPVMARFMVDENDQPVPSSVGMRQLAKLALTQVQEVVSAFTASIKEKAVPKVNGDASKSDSELDASPPGAAS